MSKLRLFPPATPAVPVGWSERSLKLAHGIVEGMIASGTTKRERRDVLAEILLRCHAAVQYDEATGQMRVRIIVTGE